MSLHDDVMFWNQANVKIHDIRRIRIEADAGRYEYRLPAGSYIYFTQGSALVWLDDRAYRVSGNDLLHGCKGMRLCIEAPVPLEFIIILYRAAAPPERRETLPNGDPSLQAYAFTPLYPADLRESAQKMFRAWQAFAEIERLHAKSLFYHFVYQLHWQMQRQIIVPLRPSLLDQALRYMNDHYGKPITVESVAKAVNCSTRYLNKLFNSKLQESPVRVLTRIRLETAMRLLTLTDLTLHEIAESTSYSDARALSRVFKNELGVTPLSYRRNCKEKGDRVPKSSPNSSDEVVLCLSPECYNENSYHNQLNYNREGVIQMFRRSKPRIAAVLFVAFTVLLGGCGNSGETGNSSQATNADSSPSASAAPTASATAQESEASVKSYTDKFGTRDIPVNPQRIYSIGATSPLLAVGVHPVGAPKYEVEPDYYLSHYENPITIVGDYPPDYEAIISLEPDLIIASDYIDSEVYGNLAKIAPTATFQWAGQDIYGQLTQVAAIVGKADEAAAWIEQHKERASAAKEKASQLVGADETTAILWISKDSFQVVGNRNVGHVLYSLLGMKPTPNIQSLIDENKGELVFTDHLSLEVLPEYDADRLVVMVSDVDAGADDNYKKMQESGLWKNLKAVKNNKVYEVPYDKWWSYTVFSADGLLEDAVRLFQP
ncbi:ABC transporter substrate-binding protein [Paenibacillus sp. YIM B09110]|uniref:ABC transporter substrate-binding protein n=1 Tax=Paenibacillus sp. YIM B09110 TaxID=3126102 RepID=UPI00301D1A24